MADTNFLWFLFASTGMGVCYILGHNQGCKETRKAMDRVIKDAWNHALDEAAVISNIRFLVDPLTSPAEHILGLRRK